MTMWKSSGILLLLVVTVVESASTVTASKGEKIEVEVKKKEDPEHGTEDTTTEKKVEVIENGASDPEIVKLEPVKEQDNCGNKQDCTKNTEVETATKLAAVTESASTVTMSEGETVEVEVKKKEDTGHGTEDSATQKKAEDTENGGVEIEIEKKGEEEVKEIDIAEPQVFHYESSEETKDLKTKVFDDTGKKTIGQDHYWGVSIKCLDCLCGKDCDLEKKCVRPKAAPDVEVPRDSGNCGPFFLSYPFWRDVHNDTETGDRDLIKEWEDCSFDMICATETIQQYIHLYPHDCDKNGKVDCLDYVAIHWLGPFGCQVEHDLMIWKHYFRKDVLQCLVSEEDGPYAKKMKSIAEDESKKKSIAIEGETAKEVKIVSGEEMKESANAIEGETVKEVKIVSGEEMKESAIAIEGKTATEKTVTPTIVPLQR